MENQHRKIRGYRELNQAEIDLMNRVKVMGVDLEALLSACIDSDRALSNDPTATVFESEDLNEAARWRAIAKTHFQQGLMALTRAVAKPSFF